MNLIKTFIRITRKPLRKMTDEEFDKIRTEVNEKYNDVVERYVNGDIDIDEFNMIVTRSEKESKYSLLDVALELGRREYNRYLDGLFEEEAGEVEWTAREE